MRYCGYAGGGLDWKAVVPVSAADFLAILVPSTAVRRLTQMWRDGYYLSAPGLGSFIILGIWLYLADIAEAVACCAVADNLLFVLYVIVRSTVMQMTRDCRYLRRKSLYCDHVCGSCHRHLAVNSRETSRPRNMYFSARYDGLSSSSW
jgi:hypothetical protein